VSVLGGKAAPLLLAVLTPLSAPLAKKPSAVRHSVGWIACGSIFFAAVLWGVVLTRKPATIEHEDGAFDFKEGEPPKLPVAMSHESPAGEEGAQAAGTHGEAAPAGAGQASSGHGGASKADAHAETKSKPPAKKPSRKNRVADKKKPAPAGEHH
jgi:hypothetical protein